MEPLASKKGLTESLSKRSPKTIKNNDITLAVDCCCFSANFKEKRPNDAVHAHCSPRSDLLVMEPLFINFVWLLASPEKSFCCLHVHLSKNELGQKTRCFPRSSDSAQFLTKTNCTFEFFAKHARGSVFGGLE